MKGFASHNSSRNCQKFLYRSPASRLQVKVLAQSVPFSIQVTQKVAFGESIKAVGNAPAFGDWDAGKGAALQWQEGHVWTAKFNLAIGKTLRFKLVKVGNHRTETVWESGNDREVTAVDPDHGLHMSCIWDNTKKAAVESCQLEGDDASRSPAGLSWKASGPQAIALPKEQNLAQFPQTTRMPQQHQAELSFDAAMLSREERRDPLRGDHAVSGSAAMRTSAMQTGLLGQQLEAAREQMLELKKYESMYRELRIEFESRAGNEREMKRELADKDDELKLAYGKLESAALERVALRKSLAELEEKYVNTLKELRNSHLDKTKDTSFRRIPASLME